MVEHSNTSNEDYKLVEDVAENVSTDTVTDLKVGIYNLFINLYRAQIPQFGPQQSKQSSIDFLEEIIYNFKSAIDNKEI